MTTTATVTTTQTQSNGVSSSEITFIDDQLAVSEACALGATVDPGWQTTAANATGQSVTQYFKPVLVMQKEPSNAYVCVTYRSLTGAQLVNSSFYNQTIDFGFGVSVCHRLPPQNGTGLECSPSHGLAGSAFPSQVTLTNYTGTFTVIYNVTSTAGSTGFYDNAGDVFWGYPLASGYTASQVNASDFQIRLIPPGGAFEPIHSISVSVIGMNVEYLDFTCTTYPMCIS